MNTLKIYKSNASAGNAVAQIIIPNRSTIKAVAWSAHNGDSGAHCRFEISRASATEIGVNGAQQCIAEVDLESFESGTPASAVAAGQNGFIPCDVPVVQGQIIYLHMAGDSTTNEFSAVIYYA